MMSQRTKLLVVISLLYMLLAVFALWFMFYQVNLAGGELKQQSDMIASTLAQEKKIGDLNKLLKSTTDTRETLESFVLTESKTIDFLAQVEKIGSDRGVEVKTTTLEVTDEKNEFPTLTVRFAISGEEAAVTSMVGIFESLPYHSELRSLRMDRDVDDPSLVTMNIALAISMNK